MNDEAAGLFLGPETLSKKLRFLFILVAFAAPDEENIAPQNAAWSLGKNNYADTRYPS